MLFFLSLVACEAELKSHMYDISSTVLVSDESGQQIDAEDVEICQLFRSEDFDTTTDWSVHAERCDQEFLQRSNPAQLCICMRSPDIRGIVSAQIPSSFSALPCRILSLSAAFSINRSIHMGPGSLGTKG